MTPEETSLDEILGGRVKLRQFVRGHRVGADAVLLAAAAGPPVGNFVDVGTGVGAVALALLARWPDARGTGVEIESGQAALARENGALNGVSGRFQVIEVDALDGRARRAAGLADGEADLVVTNPPYLMPGATRASPDPRRARAHVLGGGDDPLSEWIIACLAMLRPGGRLQMIQRADTLAPILAAFGKRLGAVTVRPVHPRADSEAIRVLVGGIKGSKAPLRVLPGLVLHEADGAFTELSAGIHRGEAML